MLPPPRFDPLQMLAGYLSVASAIVCPVQVVLLKALQNTTDAQALYELPLFLQAIAAVFAFLFFFAMTRRVSDNPRKHRFLWATLIVVCLIFIVFLVSSTFSRLNTAFQSLSIQNLIIREPLLIGAQPEQIEDLFLSGAEIRDYTKCPTRDVTSKSCWIGTSQIVARYRNVNKEWDRYSRHVIRDISIRGTTAIVTGVTETRPQDGVWKAAGYEVWKCERVSKTTWNITTFIYNIPMKEAILRRIVATL